MNYTITLACDVEIDAAEATGEDAVLAAVRYAHEWYQENIHRATVTVTDEAGVETQVDLYEVAS
jgi:hypothetical protein